MIPSMLFIRLIGLLGLSFANDHLPDDPFMSYLHFPHLHFNGIFWANVATINNNVKDFDIEKFMSHDALRVDHGGKGMWNPKGTNDFLFKDTYVTNVCYANGKCVSDKKKDILCGKKVMDGGYGSFAKFVDIDPQGQIVPEIWALKVKIPGFFEADMVPTPLQSFWNRQIDKMGDMGKGGFYQSVLKNIRWGQTAEQSPFINQIIQVMHKVKSNQLSIKFFLDKYDMMYTRKTFAQGRLIGTIGVSGPKSPSVSTWGRTMLSNFPKFGNRAPFVIDKSFKRLIIDFENSLPLDNNGLPLKAKYRTWYVAYSKSPLANITSSTKFHIIDSVDLADGHWFEKFAGIKWFPLTDHQISELENTPLLLLNYNGTYDKQNTSNFLRAQLQEATDGIHILRYHNFVHRKEPGEHIKQKVFVTKFGRPHANAKIDITATPGVYDSMTQKFLDCGQPKLPIPNTSIRTGKDGIAEIKMETIDPKRIRRIIDGQGYAHYYSVNGSDLQRKQKELKEGSDGVNSILDFMFLTRVYDNFTVTDTVNWVDHIYPIFRQYAILFPVMRSRTFKMDSYFDVVSHKQITSLSLGLPITHPSYMPATRDLSKQKRKVILDWLAKENPPIGDVRKLLTALFLKERLYTAIEITHSSIPVYFTALWSLKPGYNTQIKKVLTNSVQRSLLHLGLMSNILTAIGGSVNFHYATFRTNYPSALPDGTQPSLVISLEKFSKSFLKNVLLEMKKPDRNTLDIGFREVLFNQEVHYRSLCKNKPHGASSGRKAHGGETNKNCDTFESDYEHHLNSCRHAVKEYLAKSHQAVHDNLNSYLDSKDRDFFNYRSSIGKFYNHILVVFAKLTDCGTNNTIFAYTPDKMNRTHQIYSGMFNGMNNTYGNFLELFKKRIFSVKNYFDVVKAIRLLFTEDQSVTPCDPPKSQEHLTENDSFGKMNDLSQYTMFMSIYKGHAPVLVPSSYEPSKGQGSKRNDKKYVEKICNEKTYEFSGEKIPFDKNGVWPIVSNPARLPPYKINSTLSKISELFDKLYASFLYSFEGLFTREYTVNSLKYAIPARKKILRTAQKFLFLADQYGKQLVQTPLAAGGDPNIGPNAAPSYKYQYLPKSVITQYSKSADMLIRFNYNLTAAKKFMKHKAKKTKKSQVKQMKLTMERYHMKSFHLFYDPSNKAKHGHSVYGNSEAENTIPEDFKSNDLPENIKNDDSENDVIPKNIDNEDPIEYILRPVEDPLESLLKKKKNKKFYDSWDDLESDPNQSRTESLCSDPIVTDAEFNEDEENEGIPLRIDTLH